MFEKNFLDKFPYQFNNIIIIFLTQYLQHKVNIILFGTLLIFISLTIINYQRYKYKKLSTTDTLTKIPNLSYVLKYGETLIKKGYKVTAYMLDIDHFREINDTYGHIVGNKVLVQLAQFLKEFISENKGIVGRLGGDEFLILVPNISKKKAKDFLYKLNSNLNHKYFEGDKELTPIKITCSVGMCYTDKEPIKIEEILHLADVNMYYIKQKLQGKLLNNRLDEMLNDAYNHLINILFEKDVYSYVHSQFVVQYATLLGKHLRLSPKEIRDISLSCWLHDIGKIFIPNSILRKRGKLTAKEYSIIKTHVLWGLNILSSFNLPQNIIDGIKYHHERWDGNGYPYGLSGKDTPLAARIIQIADSFSAMTIKRVYREKLSYEEALCELQNCSGTQFDPFLLKKFAEAIKTITINGQP